MFYKKKKLHGATADAADINVESFLSASVLSKLSKKTLQNKYTYLMATCWPLETLAFSLFSFLSFLEKHFVPLELCTLFLKIVLSIQDCLSKRKIIGKFVGRWICLFPMKYKNFLFWKQITFKSNFSMPMIIFVFTLNNFLNILLFLTWLIY